MKDSIEEIIRLNDQKEEIQEALVKYTEQQIDALWQIRNELQREFFKLFTVRPNEFQDCSEEVSTLIKLADEAIVEQEDLLKKLESEKFFENQREYEKLNLPDFSANQQGQSIIVEHILK